jgi:LmbE family N-acetylglucosaminyl deacetylase
VSFSQSKSFIHLRKDMEDLPSALESCTHLGVGAHPDDLEVMAHHGILQCFGSAKHNFFGVTCTTGGGSTRSSQFENLSEEEFIEKRKQEQILSATKGEFCGCALLGFCSQEIKNQYNQSLLKDLIQVIEGSQPEVVYTHNLFDKHKTHVSVTLHLIEALKMVGHRPKSFFGVEVWRSLDWLADEKKQVLAVEDPQMVRDLIDCHQTQTSEKKYHEATLGRMRANATFFDALKSDQDGYQLFALDYLPLLQGQTLKSFYQEHIQEFQDSLETNLQGLMEGPLWK